MPGARWSQTEYGGLHDGFPCGPSNAAGGQTGHAMPSGGAGGPPTDSRAPGKGGTFHPTQNVHKRQAHRDLAPRAAFVAMLHTPTETMRLVCCSGQGGEALLC